MGAGDLEVRGVGSFKDEMKESPLVCCGHWEPGVSTPETVCSLDNCTIFLAAYYRAFI